jgi:hypothetical protein
MSYNSSFEYFKDGFGLVTKRDPTTENCNLHYAQYLVLKSKPNVLDLVFFGKNMKMKLNDRGLYNRRSIEPLPVRSVSKDEILGFMTASHLLNTEHKNKIWKHLITHGGGYNNSGRLLDYLPFNPGNFYNWGQLVGSKLSYLFLPIFVINLMIACNKKPQETSSKLLYDLIFRTIPKTFINKILFKYYDKKMKSQYGDKYLYEMYCIYFAAESKTEFPLFVQLGV